MVETETAKPAPAPEHVGERLREARMRMGIDLSDVAARTRIPLRHLAAIEIGDYSGFPSPTYCIGFARAYARIVAVDEVEIAQAMRGELGTTRPPSAIDYAYMDDSDPARIPSRLLAWAAAAVAVVIASGYGIWRSQWLDDPTVQPFPITASAEPATPVLAATSAAAIAPPRAQGQVVLAARQPVWLRVYDADDKVLFEKEMAAGESYPVPAEARDPQIRTGRADLIDVTVDGKSVAPLGPPDRTVKDVGVSAIALAAREGSARSIDPTAIGSANP